jgi:pimeloyl-ACP methyl ester carboxylesterase
MARELHTLLQNAGILGPYVLVGHSFGGLVTRVFASAYPSEVVGLVWVEAVHPDNFPRKGLPESTLQGRPPESTTFIPPMARLGVMRLAAFLPPDPDLPAQQQSQYRAMFAATKFWDSIVATERSFPDINAQARGVESLGNIPLIIVIGGESESTGVGVEMQNELMTLSTQGVQRIVLGATHNSLMHDPQHAQQTSAAILEVVEAARTGERLKP